MAAAENAYYVPHGSKWPITGSIGLFCLLGGFASMLNGSESGHIFMMFGAAIFVFMLFGWFGTVIGESEAGIYNDQVDVSFRWGMAWFILSEVLFFAAFFGALYYARELAVPWLGGEGKGVATNTVLWSNFESSWPTNGPTSVGGTFDTIPAFGIPALNTAILLTSGLTCTLAHWALKREDRGKLVAWLAVTVLLGLIFLSFQAVEFSHAYSDLNLTLGSGIYGSTFFMLTGFSRLARDHRCADALCYDAAHHERAFHP